jgi:hypothetical protein
MSFTREQIETAVKAKGYRYFDKGIYNVNVIGVRNSTPGKKVTNLFDDWLTISFKGDDETWQFYCWLATTDPGKAPMALGNNGRGTARVVPGQYPGSHFIRKHQGKYDALCQKALIRLYRDADKDMEYDEDKIMDSHNDGINIHKAGQDSTWIDHWSHGCQVFKRVKDFDEFMKICKKAAALHGNSFTYTLIESKDII